MEPNVIGIRSLDVLDVSRLAKPLYQTTTPLQEVDQSLCSIVFLMTDHQTFYVGSIIPLGALTMPYIVVAI